jgi:hypothetical protein
VTPGPVTTELDPFDLPDWLGETQVTWCPDAGIGSGHLLPGRLLGEPDLTQPFDLFAVDEAYPRPVADDQVRTRSHLAWRHGQVLLVSRGQRPTAAVPGRDFTAERVLDTLARVARAVGADPERYAARLRIGVDTAPTDADGG